MRASTNKAQRPAIRVRAPEHPVRPRQLYRQVSWLRRSQRPSAFPASPLRLRPVASRGWTLSAYSRGGGRGLGPFKGLSHPAFPFHAQRLALLWATGGESLGLEV
jgi:hypothetical protein